MIQSQLHSHTERSGDLVAFLETSNMGYFIEESIHAEEKANAKRLEAARRIRAQPRREQRETDKKETLTLYHQPRNLIHIRIQPTDAHSIACGFGKSDRCRQADTGCELSSQ